MNRRVLLELAARAWMFRGRVLAAVVLLVLAKLAAAGVPLMLKRVVDALSRPEALAAVPLAFLAGYAVVRFANTLFTEMRDLVFSRVSQSTVADFTVRIFRHLHALPARFHMQRATGALTRDVERGTSGIGFLLNVALFTIVPTLVEIALVMAILMTQYALQFTGVLLATFVAYVAFTIVFTGRRAIHQRSLNDLDSNANRRLVDSLLNFETVRLYVNEAYEVRRFQDILRRWTEAGVRNQMALTRLHVGQSGIIACGVAAVMIMAGQGVAAGTMTVGDLILINAYVIQVCLPLNSLGFVFREASDALVKSERLFQLLGERPEVDEGPQRPVLDVGDAEVRFERVSFGYEPARQVLFEVDFAIPPGKTVAVVGGSGSGKSTLARLLLGFYEVTAGAVRINGRDIREVAPQSLRQAIGIVPQDTSLFNETIAHNIAYGRIGAAESEVIAAAKAANVHEFISAMPEGYETMVGERGLKLSGGEKQRIAIARAILKNPPILIFDEATSALDTRTERAIQDELERLSTARTTLVIAHRLSTVVNAHEIIVMDQGRVAERGRHEDLLATGGLYAQMWRLQQQERELHAAEQRAAMRPVSLAALIAEAIDGIRAEIQERNIHLYTTLAPGSTQVTADPRVLQDVVWDLVAHAVQVSGTGSRVEVRLERVGNEACLEVTDQHAPPLATVRQGSDAPGVLPGGAAFDPARLRKLVADQGGRFTIRHAGRGATYVVALPLRAVEATSDTGPREFRRDAPSLQGARILVVDDNDDAREVLGAVLHERGSETDALATGNAALEYLQGKERWPDLLVCDIGLPDIDGYAVLRKVRAIEAQRDVPLARRMPAIALTGYAEAEDRTRALMAGFQVHLAKPVDPRELLATIATLLADGAASSEKRTSTR